MFDFAEVTDILSQEINLHRKETQVEYYVFLRRYEKRHFDQYSVLV